MKATRSLLQVFQSRKMASLLLLGFASGLPFLLIRDSLQAWMTQEKLDISTIIWFSLVALPYSLKFLWSPLLDRFVPPFFGRRRGWIFLTQVALVAAIALMSIQTPSSSNQALNFLAINAVAIAFLSASQDIAIDAYRTDVLEERELGAGVAIWILGYRIALLITGSLAFILADWISWSGVYRVMAGLMALELFVTAWSPEPELQDQPPVSLVDAVVLPFQDFFRQRSVIGGILVLTFILLYKLGDSLAGIVSTPFLLQTGFSQTDIGAIKGGMGLIATIIGTLCGGAVLSKIGINKSLWIFGGLQAISNLSYAALAIAGKNYPLMTVAVNIENFCAGLGTAAFVAFLMSLCNPRFSATQYALLSSLMAVSRDIVVSPAGELAKVTQWPLFFLISLIAAIPGLLLLPFFAPWHSQSAKITIADIDPTDL